MAIEAISTEEYDDPTDLDLANVLYLQYIPDVPNPNKEALCAKVKSINSWAAYQLTSLEDHIRNRVNDGGLPRDASPASITGGSQVGLRNCIIHMETCLYRRLMRW